MNKVSKELIGANSKILILLIVKRVNSYGYSISNEIKEISNGLITLKEGIIYPILKKLEMNGFIKSNWEFIEGERPRKYYKITSKGVKELDSLLAERAFVNNVVDTLQSKTEKGLAIQNKTKN